MNWLSQSIESATPLQSSEIETALLNGLITSSYRLASEADLPVDDTRQLRQLYLAAAFDLVVAAEYYRNVANANWSYCPSQSDPFAFYVYTNACPRCLIEGKDFCFCSAHKPQSGKIGAATSRLLSLFLQELFRKKGGTIDIFKGKEPIDTIFLGKTEDVPIALFAEVKSAPLLTLPLAISSDRLTIEKEGDVVILSEHYSQTVSLSTSEIQIALPSKDNDSETGWKMKFFPLGRKQHDQDSDWAYRGMVNLVDNHPSFFREYVAFWIEAFRAYSEYNKNTLVYWLTNACGQPIPKPASWPNRQKGEGYESISDSKTSVGMDRTDDIKKSIYQVLKLGAEGKPSSSDVKYLVAVVSNIHAVRHFDEYLSVFKDIVWTRDQTGTIKYASQLDPDIELFNLFDGLISLTQTISRDEWITSAFDF
jgi:hypothetical protein